MIRSILLCIGRLPLKRVIPVLTFILNVILFFLPAVRRTAFDNLLQAFPEKTQKEREEIYKKSIVTFAQVLFDALRLPVLEGEWFKKHVAIPNLAHYKALKSSSPIGVILAAGHLGSFEMMAAAAPQSVGPISFLARSLKQPVINNIARELREFGGNLVIDRNGATREMIRTLSRGRDVGILCDHNVTEQHATFVPFFGKLAATTRLPGLAAVRLNAPILLTTVQNLPDERYVIHIDPIQTDDILSSDASLDQKVDQLMKRISAQLETRIRACPEGWFWLHKRWRTQPASTEVGLIQEA